MLWEINFYQMDKGKIVGRGVYDKKYKRKKNAEHIANKVYGDPTKFRWYLVGKREPKPQIGPKTYSDSDIDFLNGCYDVL